MYIENKEARCKFQAALPTLNLNTYEKKKRGNETTMYLKFVLCQKIPKVPHCTGTSTKYGTVGTKTAQLGCVGSAASKLNIVLRKIRF